MSCLSWMPTYNLRVRAWRRLHKLVGHGWWGRSRLISIGRRHGRRSWVFAIRKKKVISSKKLDKVKELDTVKHLAHILHEMWFVAFAMLDMETEDDILRWNSKVLRVPSTRWSSSELKKKEKRMQRCHTGSSGKRNNHVLRSPFATRTL